METIILILVICTIFATAIHHPATSWQYGKAFFGTGKDVVAWTVKTTIKIVNNMKTTTVQAAPLNQTNVTGEIG